MLVWIDIDVVHVSTKAVGTVAKLAVAYCKFEKPLGSIFFGGNAAIYTSYATAVKGYYQ